MSAGTGSSISVSRDTLARFFGKNKLFVEKACTHDVVSNPDSRTCTECNESPGEWNAKLGGIRLSLLCVHCERGKTDGTSCILGAIPACPGEVFAEVSRCGWMGYEVYR
jgi:hypothetical protein